MAAFLDFLLLRCRHHDRARSGIDESIKGNMLRHARTRSSLFEIIKVLKSTADVARRKNGERGFGRNLD